MDWPWGYGQPLYNFGAILFETSWRQTNRSTDEQTDRQTDRQTDTGENVAS